MVPYEFRVTCESAGQLGCIYHVRVWLRRPFHEVGEEAWRCVLERQIDANYFPGEPSKQWRDILIRLKP